MNNKTTRIMLEEIRMKIDQDYGGDIPKVAEAYLKENPFLVDREDGILYPIAEQGWIVVELISEDSDARRPKPTVHEFVTEEEAKNKAQQLYKGCNDAWIDMVCIEVNGLEWRVEVGSRRQEQRVEANPGNLIELGAQQIATRIHNHLNDLSGDVSKGVMPFRTYNSLDEIKSEWRKPTNNFLTEYANYIQMNHRLESGAYRMLSKIEHRQSQNHSGKYAKPKSPATKLRMSANPDFVESLYAFLCPDITPSISEVTARSHFHIAEFYGENPKLRASLVSEMNTTRAFTDSSFRDTVTNMTKFGFTMQAIIDRNTNQCVGSLNLDQMVHLLSSKKSDMPLTLDPDELKKHGILGITPPTLDGNAPVTQAEALFASGCKSILFDYSPPVHQENQPPNTAQLEPGLHIMTAHDLVAYATLVDE